MSKERLQVLYEALKGTDDFLERMDIQSEIDDIRLAIGELLPPKPLDSPYLCEGCSG